MNDTAENYGRQDSDRGAGGQCHSPGDFMRRIVFDYVRHGYTRAALFEIPERKAGDVARIDRKLREDYRITDCRTTRMRQRRAGIASLVHLRFRRWVLLLATDGVHPQEGRVMWHDLREKPLTIFGYTVAVEHEEVSVTVARRKWERIERVGAALALDDEANVRRFLRWMGRVVAFNVPGVVRQKQKLTDTINHTRQRAGLPVVGRPKKS
jgi:hypothetical protein